MKNKQSKDRLLFILSYSSIFLFISAILAFLFYSKGKSLINYAGDGYREYYKTLIYYSRHLRTVLTNIFINHTFEIPMFEMAIGDGSDIVQTFHFVGVGEPFTFFSFLVKEEYMYIFYDLMIFVRLYCAGLSFSFLCYTYNSNHKWQGVLIGSLAYVFCNYSLTSATTHPFFLNPLVWFPLIIAGVEKVLKGEKPHALIIGVFFASVSNVYFFYMCVVLTVIYGVVRALIIKGNLKDAINVLFVVAGYSLLGTMLGAVMFMPMFYALFTNSRMSVERVYLFFSTLEGYKNFVYSFAIGNANYFGGYTPIIIFSLIALFKEKHNKTIYSLLFIALIFCIFPICGQFLNAMTYATDRWMFGLAPLMCYIIVFTYDDILNTSNNRFLYITLIVIYYALSIILNRNQYQIHAMYCVGSIAIMAITLLNNEKLLNITFIGFTVFSICFVVVYWFSPMWWNKSNQGTDISIINNIFDDETAAINNIKDDDFWRYGGDNLSTNSSLFTGHSGSQFYWSVSNNYVAEFRKEIGLSDRSTIHYDNYDDRFALLALASEKYFVSNDESLIPYSYVKKDTFNEYKLYSSTQTLPLVYGYDNYISYDNFLDLDVELKNELITKTAIAEIELPNFISDKPIFNTKQLPYNVSLVDGLDINDNVITVNNGDAKLTIDVEGELYGEYYLIVEGLDSDISSYIKVETSNINKLINYKDRSHPRYSNRHDFVICLGTHKELHDSISIIFPDSGTFSYSSIRVACMPIENLEGNIKKLNNVRINSYEVNTNEVKANISLDSDEIVCISIPYSKGWKAYVDGREAYIFNINIKNIGLVLEKGNHSIELKYETPLLKIGFITSLLSALSYFVISKKIIK